MKPAPMNPRPPARATCEGHHHLALSALEVISRRCCTHRSRQGSCKSHKCHWMQVSDVSLAIVI